MVQIITSLHLEYQQTSHRRQQMPDELKSRQHEARKHGKVGGCAVWSCFEYLQLFSTRRERERDLLDPKGHSV